MGALLNNRYRYLRSILSVRFRLTVSSLEGQGPPRTQPRPVAGTLPPTRYGTGGSTSTGYGPSGGLVRVTVGAARLPG